MEAAGWEPVDGDVSIPSPPNEEWLWAAMKKVVRKGEEIPLRAVSWPPGGQTIVYVFKEAKSVPAAKPLPKPDAVKVLDRTSDWKLQSAVKGGDLASNREYIWTKLPDEIAGGTTVLRSMEESTIWMPVGKVQAQKNCTMYAIIRGLTPAQVKAMKSAGWESVESDVEATAPPNEKWHWGAMKKPVKKGEDTFTLKGLSWPAQGQTVVFVFKQ